MREHRLIGLLQSDVIDKKDCYVEFEYDIQHKRGLFAQKGETIGGLTIKEYVKSGVFESLKSIGYGQLIAPYTAVYDFTELLGIVSNLSSIPIKQFIDNDIVICKSYDDFQEMAEDFIKKYCNYVVSDDIFKGEKKIIWNHYYPRFEGLEKSNAFQLRFLPVDRPYFRCFPFVRLDNGKEQFVFQYGKKDFSIHKFVKGDSFHFVFENNKHLEYYLKNAAANTNNSDYRQVTFTLLPQDIKLFASESLIAIRCEFQNGDAPLDLKKENELASLTFKLYFQKYIKALLECGVDIDSVVYKDGSGGEVEKEPSKSIKEESCFVYLMKDESNGYHKIGISNKPEYRERTLQSEKPTIVLLCAKEYPSRIIAEAIESALHKAFTDKRIRGEWFSLTEKDVKEIKMTLN